MNELTELFERAGLSPFVSEELAELLFRIGVRCNIDQYRMLLRCSKNKNITEWDNWRKDNSKEEIWLSGAKLLEAHLDGVDLREAHLERAELGEAHLVGANLTYAYLEGAYLRNAHMERAELGEAHLEGAHLSEAHLEGAELYGTHLEGVNLVSAHLEDAKLGDAHLESADLWGAYMERTDLQGAHLQDADFEAVSVDGRTYIWYCEIDRDTNFTGVNLDSACVDPGLKQSLEYNIRLKRWQEWYEDHRWLKLLVWLFWQMSDYGRSTPRILQSFAICALFFACMYLFVGMGCYWLTDGQDTGMIANLLAKDGVVVPGWLVPVRVLYFSVVTMTTLGFGDMYAQPDSLAGHIFLGIQVLLGYVLLGALITRFAVLFTAGGPAGKFADERKTTLQRFIQTLRVNWKLIHRRKG